MRWRRMTPRRAHALLRRHGPEALVWRRRIAILGGAIMIGLTALLFARASDWAGEQFLDVVSAWWWAPLVATPLGFAFLAWLTRKLAPTASGSGIPQVIAAARDPDSGMRELVSARTVAVKMVLTIGALLLGASVGREGPTVQVSASIMGYAHRLMAIPIRASVFIAGGAAGVAASFNTPRGRVAVPSEELAAAYEQRMTLLVMAAVLIAGMVSLGLAGDYVYFGVMRQTLSVSQALVAAPVAGLLGGLVGGLFSRGMLAVGRTNVAPLRWLRAHPILLAGVCGVIVAVTGVATGLTWGTGYQTANAVISGADVPLWFGGAKLIATLATAVSGLPGGYSPPRCRWAQALATCCAACFPAIRPARSSFLAWSPISQVSFARRSPR